MKIIDANKSFRLYIVRIISVMLAVVVGGLFVMVYIAGNSLAVRNKQNEAELLMEQAEHDIDSAVASIRNYLQYAYDSAEIYDVILSSQKDPTQVALSINQIYGDFSVFISKLHSLQFYNENTGEFYSRSAVPLSEKSNQIKEILSIESMYKSTVTMRKVELYDGTFDNVISYMFTNSDSAIKNPSYIMVNIYASWLEDIIRTERMNGVKDFIIPADETIDLDSGDNRLLAEFLLKNHIEDKYTTTDVKLDGTKYLVASKKIDTVNWYIIKLYPFKEIYAPINSLRLGIILVAVITELAVLILGYIVSKRLYGPIDDLYKEICKNPYKSKNEIEQIRNEFRLIESRKEFRLEQKKKEQSIERLLFSADKLEPEDIEQILDKNGISAEPMLLVVCAFEMADFDDFAVQNSKDDVKAILYGIYNIACELISEDYACCGVISDNGLVQFVIEIKKDDYNSRESLRKICTAVLANMKNHFNIDVNACIGNAITDVSKINDEMFETLKNFVYKYNYGPGCCITPDMIHDNINNVNGVSKTSIEHLKYAIASNDIRQVVEKIHSVFTEIKKCEYFTEHSEIILLVKTIEAELEKLSDNSITETLACRDILQQKYLGDVEKMLISNITDAMTEVAKSKDNTMNKKNTEIVDDAEQIIKDEYSNTNLCASYIADKLSVGYRLLGKLFVEKHGMSVAQYINKVRLEKSIELMRKGNMSVLKISLACGYESEAYYYRVFKKMYGMTPKQYISHYNEKSDSV